MKFKISALKDLISYWNTKFLLVDEQICEPSEFSIGKILFHTLDI
jgi:hypothetical protein